MDTLTLINRAHQGDKLARDKILIENTGLIWSIVRRFLNRGHEGEDLFQIGCIGMLKAIDRFDTEFDVAFSTYAEIRIYFQFHNTNPILFHFLLS